MDSSVLPVLRLVLDAIGLDAIAIALVFAVMMPLWYGVAGAWIMHVKDRNELGGFALGLLTGIGSVAVIVAVSEGGNHIWGTQIAGWGFGATALVMVRLFLPGKSVSSGSHKADKRSSRGQSNVKS